MLLCVYNRSVDLQGEGMAEEVTADWRKTIESLIEKSHRTAVPIAKSFIQAPRGSASRIGPLASFVSARDLRGLKAYLLIVTAASHPDPNNRWTTTLSLQAWARAFGCLENASLNSGKAAATRLLGRLVKRQLITKQRSGRGRDIKITLLAQDGSGAVYERPNRDFLKLSCDFWLKKYDERLTLPALSMLLVLLGEKQPCTLPTEHMHEWYGWSPDTAEKGLHELIGAKLISRERLVKETPLSPTGRTTVNSYSLLKPFDKPLAKKTDESSGMKDGK